MRLVLAPPPPAGAQQAEQAGAQQSYGAGERNRRGADGYPGEDGPLKTGTIIDQVDADESLP